MKKIKKKWVKKYIKKIDSESLFSDVFSFLMSNDKIPDACKYQRCNLYCNIVRKKNNISDDDDRRNERYTPDAQQYTGGYNKSNPVFNDEAYEASNARNKQASENNAGRVNAVKNNYSSSDASEDMNTQKSMISLFAIDKPSDDKIVGNHIQTVENFFDDLKNIDDILQVTEQYPNREGFGIIRKRMEEFRDEAEQVTSDTIKRIRTQMPVEMISETAVKNAFELISQKILANIMPNIYHRMINNTAGYDELLMELNSYLENLGIFTIYIDVKSKEFLSEDAAKYYNATDAPTGDKSLNGKVCCVEALPYAISYYNKSGEIAAKYFSGRVSLYNSI